MKKNTPVKDKEDKKKKKNFFRDAFLGDDLDDDEDDRYDDEDDEDDDDENADRDEDEDRYDEEADDDSEEDEPDDDDDDAPRNKKRGFFGHLKKKSGKGHDRDADDEDDEDDDEDDDADIDADRDDRDTEDNSSQNGVIERKDTDDDDDDDRDDDDDDRDDDDHDDDDDDDRDDDDDDRSDEDDSAYYRSPEYKRERRHKRRVRNQMLALITMGILVFAVIFGVFSAGKSFFGKYQEKKQAADLAAQLASMTGSEEAVTIAEPETAADETSQLDEIVNAAIKEMPVEDKVAGLFLVTPEELTGVKNVKQAGDATQQALQTYKVGGIVYASGNFQDADQVTKLLSGTSKMLPNLFLAVDEEGGDNAPLSSKLALDKVSSMSEIGASGDTAQAHQAGATIGTYLAKYGFNLDLAPVTDVTINADNQLLGKRSFGSDATTVGSMAAEFVKGLSEQKISACVRTFPGLGGAAASGDTGMVTTERSESDMEGNEFKAYKAAVDAGSEFVMVSSVSATNLTGDKTPCCLSKAAMDAVRDKLGFQGIILTDSLSDSAITSYYEPGDAAVRAINAGADMILMPSDLKAAYDGVLAAVKSGTISESRLDDSLLRIYRVKYKDKVDSLTGQSEQATESSGA